MDSIGCECRLCLKTDTHSGEPVSGEHVSGEHVSGEHVSGEHGGSCRCVFSDRMNTLSRIGGVSCDCSLGVSNTHSLLHTLV